MTQAERKDRTRAALLGFLGGSRAGWKQHHLVEWIRGPYRAAVLQKREGPMAIIAPTGGDRFVALVERTRHEVVDVLRAPERYRSPTTTSTRSRSAAAASA
jgi:hypothetical protein